MYIKHITVHVRMQDFPVGGPTFLEFGRGELRSLGACSMKIFFKWCNLVRYGVVLINF